MHPPDASLQQALSGSYRLERELGQGGMAVVYLAHDLKHDRQVALKVIRPEIAGLLGGERFSREIRLAARLQHPHIASVYDSGTGDLGQMWYTMPFVAGGSLRSKLEREGRLPIGEAVRIVREAAQALEYAHKQGVIHRDIKPENILLTEDGTTLVADFGIARRLTAPGTTAAAETQLTETGLVVGSPAYMSPEQRLGDTVDARSDVYSLAATLYEALAGERPGGGALDLLLKQITEPVPGVRLKRPEVSAELDRALQRGLEPDPARRFSGMASFAAALEAATTAPARSIPIAPAARWKRLVIPATLTLLLVAGWAGWRHWHRESKPSIVAVLPFTIPPSDTTLLDFSTALAQDLRQIFNHLPALGASTEAATKRFAGERAPELARHLGARLVVTADAARTGSEIVLTFTVRDAADNRPPVTVRFAGSAEQILAARDSLAGVLLTAVGVRPSADDLLAAGRWVISTVNPDAYVGYAGWLRRTLADHRTDRNSWHEMYADFDSILTRDPRYLDVIVNRALGRLQELEVFHSQLSDREATELRRLAGEDVRRAQAIDANNPLTLVGSATLLVSSGDTAGALRDLRRGAGIDPLSLAVAWPLCRLELRQVAGNAAAPESCRRYVTLDSLNPWTWFTMAIEDGDAGRAFDEARMARNAGRLDPTNALFHVTAGWGLERAAQANDAVREFRQALRLEPENASAQNGLGTSLLDLEQPEDAISAFRGLVAAHPDDPIQLDRLGWALSITGHSVEAIATARRAVQLAPNNPGTHNQLGYDLWRAGQFDDALGELRTAATQDPLTGSRWTNLADLLRLAGRSADAQAAVNHLNSIAPGASVVQRATAGQLVWLGRAGEAAGMMRALLAHDTLSLEDWSTLSWMWNIAGQPDSAIVAAHRALDIDSTEASSYSNLAMALWLKGRRPEALAAADDLVRLNPYRQSNYAQRIWFYGRSGRLAAAREQLDSLERRMTKYAPSVVPLVIAAIGVGDTVKARAALAQTAARRDLMLSHFTLHDPLFAPLRGTPEFQAAERKFVFSGDEPEGPNR